MYLGAILILPTLILIVLSIWLKPRKKQIPLEELMKSYLEKLQSERDKYISIFAEFKPELDKDGEKKVWSPSLELGRIFKEINRVNSLIEKESRPDD